MNDKGVCALLNEVMIQAAKDLKKCYKNGGCFRDNQKGGMIYAADIEKFFKYSPLAAAYNIDGEYIIEKIRSEFEDGKEEHDS